MRRRWGWIGAVAVLAVLVAGGWLLATRATAPSEPSPTASFAENPYDWSRGTGESHDWSIASFVAIAGFIVVPGACIGASLWAQRRRARGEEASTYHGEGADAGAAIGHVLGP